MTKPVSYSDAGVSIDTANQTVAKIRDFARSTFNARTLTEIGSFGGMFDGRFPEMEEPVLVASADGVGTKLKIAFLTGVHNTIGQDLVNHCVDDILVQGAQPLFFLDYFATGKLSADVAASVVEGLSIACRENGCVLLGGETAEMPGFYSDGEYDLAGFVVGVVDKKNVIDGSGIEEGDIVIGLPSTGLHTNGYSLARKLFFEIGGHTPSSAPDGLGGATVGEVLLTPHRSYLPQLKGLIGTGKIKGLAHITGGGLLENIPRILPDGITVEIDKASWQVPAVFTMMRDLGNVEEFEMFRTFNMGIGMTVFCSPDDRESVEAHISGHGGKCAVIGKAVAGDGTVRLV